MGRAPCCEKVGLKKGPWTSEEDQVLVSYIYKNGHGNWRALPKLAGLLRCGKSCRLRWTNYLRPDIKRGNFSKEEEETIIKLHEILGNRWSAIAARLPGRTDNEIKNVWHTHLKKKLKNYQTSQDANRLSTNLMQKSDPRSPMKTEDHSDKSNFNVTNLGCAPVSPQHSSSEVSTVTESSAFTDATLNNLVVKHEKLESPEYFPQIDESFWTEELSEDTANVQSQFHHGVTTTNDMQFQFELSPMAASDEDMNAYASKFDDGMSFWYDLFIRAGELPDLPDF